MKSRFILIIFLSLFCFPGCSDDKTDKQTLKKTSPEQVENKPSIPTPNPPSLQELQPDLHLSGTQSTHISGSKLTSSHVSGR